MNKEQIEKAVNDYIGYSEEIDEGINTLWHGANEESVMGNKPILVEYNFRGNIMYVVTSIRPGDVRSCLTRLSECRMAAGRQS